MGGEGTSLLSTGRSVFDFADVGVGGGEQTDAGRLVAFCKMGNVMCVCVCVCVCVRIYMYVCVYVYVYV